MNVCEGTSKKVETASAMDWQATECATHATKNPTPAGATADANAIQATTRVKVHALKFIVLPVLALTSQAAMWRPSSITSKKSVCLALTVVSPVPAAIHALNAGLSTLFVPPASFAMKFAATANASPSNAMTETTITAMAVLLIAKSKPDTNAQEAHPIPEMPARLSSRIRW